MSAEQIWLQNEEGSNLYKSWQFSNVNDFNFQTSNFGEPAEKKNE